MFQAIQCVRLRVETGLEILKKMKVAMMETLHRTMAVIRAAKKKMGLFALAVLIWLLIFVTGNQ